MPSWCCKINFLLFLAAAGAMTKTFTSVFNEGMYDIDTSSFGNISWIFQQVMDTTTYKILSCSTIVGLKLF
jgi:hypothetical protein